MSKKLIGREDERSILQQSLISDKAEFVAVIGRRRVGKTFLIKQVYNQDIDFELTGLQHANKSEQLQGFIFALLKSFPDVELTKRPKNWLDAFFLLTELLESLNKQEKIVVFLDELPWLASKRSGFLTALGWFWNSWAVNQHIVLVVCGSAASWMIEKVINDKGGLHNRVTRLVFLNPFTLRETEAFLQSKKIHLNRYQITQLYLTMGGIPMYLDQVQPGLSAVQNIQAICFQPRGYLRMEFDRLFSSLFDDSKNHLSVIHALAKKKKGMTREEIVTYSSLPNGGVLTRTLKELSQSGFIDIYAGYGKKKQLSLYRLTDAYSLFYLSFMEGLTANSQVDFSKLSDLQSYKSWSGYAFENVCLKHVDSIKKALGISGIYTAVASFYAKRNKEMPGAQIDLLIDRGDHSINIIEIKFSSEVYEFTKSDVERMANRKHVFRQVTKTKKHLFATLITTFGAIENTNRLNHIDQVIQLDDLFD